MGLLVTSLRYQASLSSSPSRCPDFSAPKLTVYFLSQLKAGFQLYALKGCSTDTSVLLSMTDSSSPKHLGTQCEQGFPLDDVLSTAECAGRQAGAVSVSVSLSETPGACPPKRPGKPRGPGQSPSWT